MEIVVPDPPPKASPYQVATAGWKASGNDELGCIELTQMIFNVNKEKINKTNNLMKHGEY